MHSPRVAAVLRWPLLCSVLLAASLVACGSDDKLTAATTTARTEASSVASSEGNAPGIPVLTDPVQRTASGLGYIDEKVGDGAAPQKGQQVQVHYTGWLTSGKKFDSSRDRGQPFVFQIGAGQVIAGWDEGVATMKVGGKRRLIIPANLGYGARGAGAAVPPNAILIFDVELLAVR